VGSLKGDQSIRPLPQELYTVSVQQFDRTKATQNSLPLLSVQSFASSL